MDVLCAPIIVAAPPPPMHRSLSHCHRPAMLTVRQWAGYLTRHGLGCEVTPLGAKEPWTLSPARLDAAARASVGRFADGVFPHEAGSPRVSVPSRGSTRPFYSASAPTTALPGRSGARRLDERPHFRWALRSRPHPRRVRRPSRAFKGDPRLDCGRTHPSRWSTAAATNLPPGPSEICATPSFESVL